MESEHGDLALPSGFNNIVRLFPLPNLVLFPGVIQALHIFEPRYRELVEDSLAGDQLITMALLKDEIQGQVQAQPLIHPVVCIGKIITHAKLDDGRYNLLLQGACRAGIATEISAGKPYRMAEVVVINSESPENSEEIQRELRKQLVDQFRELAISRQAMDFEAVEKLMESSMPLGMLVDLIAYSCGASPFDQQMVLEATPVAERARQVLRIVQRQLDQSSDDSDSGGFPPKFSAN